MAIDSDIMIGSVTIAAQSFDADDGSPGSSAASVAAGDYYLRHTTAGLSLIDVMVTSLTAAGVTSPTVVVLQSGKIKIAGSGTFYITWGSATTLRRLLGFTANCSGASTYTAAEPSPLLLCPGYPFTTPEIAGVDGYDVDDATRTPSADYSEIETDYHQTGTFCEWSVYAVEAARVRNTNTIGGNTIHQFRADVLVPGYRFFWYESATVDFVSAAALTWPTGTSVHGPYQARTVPRQPAQRTMQNSNDLWGYSLDGMLVGEYS